VQYRGAGIGGRIETISNVKIQMSNQILMTQGQIEKLGFSHLAFDIHLAFEL
jgi:hypothetical protein